MKINVNGESKVVKDGISIKNLLSELLIKSESVVVELNLRILSKDEWHNTILKENDSLEIVRFVGGG